MNKDSLTMQNLIHLRKVLYRVAEGRISELEKPVIYAQGRTNVREQKVNRDRPYNQRHYSFPCGAPACALGWYFHSGGLEAPPTSVRIAFPFPDLSEEEQGELFSIDGCGRAGTSARKAARFVGAFIRRKLAEG